MQQIKQLWEKKLAPKNVLTTIKKYNGLILEINVIGSNDNYGIGEPVIAVTHSIAHTFLPNLIPLVIIQENI